MAVHGGRDSKKKAAGPVPTSGREKQKFEVLHHPWRARILEVLNERNMSVSQFIDEGLIADLADQPRDRAISALAYHFRALRDAGAIEVVEQNQRRGSTELVCRGCARTLYPTDQWAKLPAHQRFVISQNILSSFLARAECAVQHGTFDSRIDRHLSWLAMEVDEQGWSELADLMNGILDTVSVIHAEAKQRLASSEETPIRATWGQLHFESPPLPPPAA